METSSPDHTWRFQAECLEADVNDFMLLDAEDLGLSPKRAKAIRSLNTLRLEETREKYCNHCSVVAECNDSAVREGSHAWSLRGALTPYEREGIKVGSCQPDGIFEDNREADRAVAYKNFLAGKPLVGEAGRYARQSINARRSSKPEDAFWEPHSIPSGKGTNAVSEGAGWALSQDPTGTTLMVLYRGAGGSLRTRFVLTKHTIFDSAATPRVLREGYPDGVTLPKETPNFFKKHKQTSEDLPLGADTPWWRENGMYV